ncbi:MAG: DUF4920 domain-containing protein [Flavobacteriales bacterium]|nr:DUF4920 domain-containing protein [Flavobacteriales bacterium]
MKKIAGIIIIIFFFSCANETNKEQEATSKTDLNEYFGDTINPAGAITTSEFLSKIKEVDSLEVKLEAKISEVCQKKGCWMDLDLENGETMTVRFKDYGFFVPKNADGRMAVVEGWAKKDTTTVELLRHYAEDAGKSKEEVEAITEPEIGYSFEAHGVVIKPKPVE